MIVSGSDKGRPELSAIVLCYRAGTSILRVVDPLYESLEAAGIAFEVVLVANYWPEDRDPTVEIVERFASEHDHAEVVTLPKEGAMGWDMRTGLAAASGRHLVVIDGDAQNPVDDVLRMYQLMKAGTFDVMKGRRVARFDGPYRRALSTAYNALFRIAFRTTGVMGHQRQAKGVDAQSVRADEPSLR